MVFDIEGYSSDSLLLSIFRAILNKNLNPAVIPSIRNIMVNKGNELNSLSSTKKPIAKPIKVLITRFIPTVLATPRNRKYPLFAFFLGECGCFVLTIMLKKFSRKRIKKGIQNLLKKFLL